MIKKWEQPHYHLRTQSPAAASSWAVARVGPVARPFTLTLPLAPVPPVIVGYDFSLLSDKGDTATVFLARTAGHQSYVVKRVDKRLRGGATETMDFFANERAALTRLRDAQHPCLPRLWGTRPAEREIWMHYEGNLPTLWDDIAEQGVVAQWPQMQLLCSCLLAALACCHGRGIAHGDVKPMNVLYSRATGKVLLIDFGFAADATTLTSNSGQGSKMFVPLETLTVRPNRDVRLQDSFGLACVLAYALLGEFPGSEAKTVTDLLGLREVDDGTGWFPSYSSRLKDAQRSLLRRLAAREPADRLQILDAYNAWPATLCQ